MTVTKIFYFLWCLPRETSVFFINIWQKTLSPDHGPLRVFFVNGGCKFTPTCSDYGKEAFRKFGFVKGFIKTSWRVMRCNPWSKGGFDPPC